MLQIVTGDLACSAHPVFVPAWCLEYSNLMQPKIFLQITLYSYCMLAGKGNTAICSTGPSDVCKNLIGGATLDFAAALRQVVTLVGVRA